MTFLDLLYLFSTPLAVGLGIAALYLVLGVLGHHGDMMETGSGFAPKTSLAKSNKVSRSAPPAARGTPLFSESTHLHMEYTDVLVVDDSAVARAKLSKLFENAGYTVRLANDGVQALAILADNPFFLMITDLEMPNMDGFELIAAVQGSMATEDMPIIAITGHDEMQARVHDCQGLYGIFKKPWNDRELLKRVSTLVQMQRQKVLAEELAAA